MSIAELGSLGEFIAAVAVLITLVYVALQIKQTQIAISANTHQALNDISIHLYTTLASNAQLAEIIDKTNSVEARLSRAEVHQVNAFWTAMIRNAENMHYQFEVGLLEEERIQASAVILRRLGLTNTYFQHLWKNLRPALRTDFVDWMEALLKRESPLPRPSY
jgi:hypothetical protein